MWPSQLADVAVTAGGLFFLMPTAFCLCSHNHRFIVDIWFFFAVAVTVAVAVTTS